MDETERLAKRKAFIDRHRHVIGGMVMDAVAGNHSTAGGRHGIELAHWSRERFRQIDLLVSQMFDELIPKEPPAPSPPAKSGSNPPR